MPNRERPLDVASYRLLIHLTEGFGPETATPGDWLKFKEGLGAFVDAGGSAPGDDHPQGQRGIQLPPPGSKEVSRSTPISE
jgi:hypothetical protein